MEQDWSLPGVTKSDAPPKAAMSDAPTELPPAAAPHDRFLRLLIIGVGLVALGAMATALWVYADGRREILRLATQMAQLRLSLDLYAQQQTQSPPQEATTGIAADARPAPDRLLNLENRLAILENSWRTQANVPLASPSPAPPSASAQTDCIPQGTKFLVSSGDVYPICGTAGSVSVLNVSPDAVSFIDGTVIGAGGTGLLNGTNCRLSVVSSEADGLSGYAELRATC